MDILWSARSRNVQTGNVPTAWIGSTREAGRESCKGCPLLDNGCYAHSGAVAMGADSVRRAARNGSDKSIDAALSGRHRLARMARLTGIGDIGRSGKAIADAIIGKVRAAGLQAVGYTHHWREDTVSDAWRGRLMASTESMEAADAAIDAGWRAAVVVPEDTPRTFVTPKGRKGIVCPAQIRDTVTCNDCRLCDGSKRGPVIGFRAHGNEAGKVFG